MCERHADRYIHKGLRYRQVYRHKSERQAGILTDQQILIDKNRLMGRWMNRQIGNKVAKLVHCTDS